MKNSQAIQSLTITENLFLKGRQILKELKFVSRLNHTLQNCLTFIFCLKPVKGHLPHVTSSVHFSSQAAAKSLARYQPSLQYASDVGVNTFVTVHVSFLPKEVIMFLIRTQQFMCLCKICVIITLRLNRLNILLHPIG